jgi:hypothetical protein
MSGRNAVRKRRRCPLCSALENSRSLLVVDRGSEQGRRGASGRASAAEERAVESRIYRESDWRRTAPHRRRSRGPQRTLHWRRRAAPHLRYAGVGRAPEGGVEKKGAEAFFASGERVKRRERRGVER